ncbi:MAG TPA: hypothetical protein PK667_07105, partial [Nitrosomonas europaea]|uniref:hypothetical protein n=1 Tax=Nitrosomonas europaea TaxID=915 RepID=UPI002CE2602E
RMADDVMRLSDQFLLCKAAHSDEGLIDISNDPLGRGFGNEKLSIPHFPFHIGNWHIDSHDLAFLVSYVIDRNTVLSASAGLIGVLLLHIKNIAGCTIQNFVFASHVVTWQSSAAATGLLHAQIIL